MLKIILPIIALAILTIFAIWKLAPSLSSPALKDGQVSQASPQPATNSLTGASPSPSSSPSTISSLTKKPNDLPSDAEKIADLENKIKNLENNQTDFSTRITKLETKTSPAPSTSTTTTTSTSKAPVFIPINSGGSVNSSDWTNLTTGSINLNPADYPGYTSMNLLITLNVYQGNGRAYARIVNSSTGNAILSSEASTTSENATQVTSTAFTLPTNQASYTIQLKTLTVNYPSIAGWSFIKVNF